MRPRRNSHFYGNLENKKSQKAMEELKKTLALYEKMLEDLKAIGHRSLFIDSIRRSKYAVQDAIKEFEQINYNIVTYKRVMLKNIASKFDEKTQRSLTNNWMPDSEVEELYAKEFGEN